MGMNMIVCGFVVFSDVGHETVSLILQVTPTTPFSRQTTSYYPFVMIFIDHRCTGRRHIPPPCGQEELHHRRLSILYTSAQGSGAMA